VGESAARDDGWQPGAVKKKKGAHVRAPLFSKWPRPRPVVRSGPASIPITVALAINLRNPVGFKAVKGRGWGCTGKRQLKSGACIDGARTGGPTRRGAPTQGLLATLDRMR
jgi:hypothetical protein